MSSVTEQSFRRDIRDHALTVRLDNGVHRHLQFRKPGTSCCGFDIVTWPGYLAFSGDMGSFVFQRLEDMLKFFRQDVAPTAALRINLPYWAEKLEAADRFSGFQKYSEQKFRQRIASGLDDVAASKKLRAAVNAEVLAFDCSDERTVRERVDAFEHGGFQFSDFWECHLDEYTPRFIWCCYALVWGIQQYDAAIAAASSVLVEAATC